jgi:hypothetical protein
MSTSSTLRIPLVIPASLQQSPNYEVQFSVHSDDLNGDIFIDKRYKASQLVQNARDGNVSMTLDRTELPRWREGGEDAEIIAHFWKGQRCVASETCGRI